MPHPITSIAHRLADHAQTRAEAHAITELGRDGLPVRSLDFETLWRRVNGLASVLLDADAGGRPVLIPEFNGIDYVVAYLACLRAGAIAVTAHAPRVNDRSGRLEAIILDSKPVRALASGSTIDHCIKHGGPILQKQTFIATDDPAFDSVQVGGIPDVPPDSIAMFQYTSGSTSQPRAVRVSHGNLIANVEAMSSLFVHEESGGTVCWLPLFHDMGLIGVVMTSLMSGLTTHLMKPEEFVMRPLRWLRAISMTRSAHSCAPNFAYGLCVERTTEEDRAALDLSSWKIALNGAETIHPDTIERFTEAFRSSGFDPGAMRACYGLAESTLLVTGRLSGTGTGIRRIDAEALTRNRLIRCEDGHTEGTVRVTACGPVIPGHDLRVLDQCGVLSDGEGIVGEICVRGPSVAQGYLQDHEDDEDAFPARLDDQPGPWLRTGDLGGLVDGELVIAGRLKDLIIVGGSNHHPHDLERTAEQAHPDVANGGCAAFAVTGEAAHGSEQVVVLVELSRERMRSLRRNPDETGPLTEELTSRVRAAISSVHSVALHACLVVNSGAIPRTTSGKVQRRSAAEAWKRGELPLLVP